MRILYYDCFAGISGDMNLGAMIDLGVKEDYLINELSKLNLQEYEIKVSRDNRKGIYGTKVEVLLSETYGHINSEEEHGHFHESHGHRHEHEHNHRNLKDIEYIIDSSELNENVKNISRAIFLNVAEAEGKIHGKSPYEVHFHEVGAVDSIVDIVGAAICLDFLKVDKVICSTVEVGSGFVKCAHGMMPVPAPATAEMLKGIKIKTRVPFEATTPTGAAILRTIVNEFKDEKDFTINKIGYGIGHRDGEIPNILRVILSESDENTGGIAVDSIKREANIIECNIDDMNPELYNYVMGKCFSQGAQDVYLTNIIMKKGRPAVKLTVLCYEDQEANIIQTILRETSTLGIRKYNVDKEMLYREEEVITTCYGQVRVKNSFLNGEKIKSKPEYDDCKLLANKNNVPIDKIYEEIKKINIK